MQSRVNFVADCWTSSPVTFVAFQTAQPSGLTQAYEQGLGLILLQSLRKSGAPDLLPAYEVQPLRLDIGKR